MAKDYPIGPSLQTMQHRESSAARRHNSPAQIVAKNVCRRDLHPRLTMNSVAQHGFTI
jgi:hypothetical protein